jgi:peptidoglycan hydrolase-like protein with peptidoglycan-binding domain
MTPRQARVALGAFVLLAGGVAGNALYLQGSPDHVAAKPPVTSPPARPDPQHQPIRPAEAKASRPSHQNTAAPAAPRSAGPKIAEPKPSEPNVSEPRPSEPRPSEPRAAAPDASDTAAPKNAQSLKVRTVRIATIGEAPLAEVSTGTDADTVRAVQAELNRRGYGPMAADGVVRPAVRAGIMAFEHEHRLPLTGEATQELLKQLLFGTPPAAGAAGPLEVRSQQAQAVIKDVQRQLAAHGYRPGAADGRLTAETVAAIRTFEADQGLVPKGRISAVLLDRLESGMAGGGRHTDP